MLERVTHCRFGNSSVTAVLAPSVAGEAVCVTPEADVQTGLDGGHFAGHATRGDPTYDDQTNGPAGAGRRRLGEEGPMAERGSVALKLSRDGRDFFDTSTWFYFYPPPVNFSAIFPGGGPVGVATNVTISGAAAG